MRNMVDEVFLVWYRKSVKNISGLLGGLSAVGTVRSRVYNACYPRMPMKRR
jgi:hypothetical protein